MPRPIITAPKILLKFRSSFKKVYEKIGTKINASPTNGYASFSGVILRTRNQRIVAQK